ncbi:uncharacterized protein N7483_010756 [Penicillium malachiteum]|uniref:uncharacterized protein n=1 Tax=Penicillium malachiteum TaxID=1324776 RepID=UPI002547DF71|nr:uncharacterized protein N7483_010756 [Penicillium malachiteum]KAJ5713575.1 hypothetical protein N7483_010756 [Penicillium malachiteum]
MSATLTLTALKDGRPPPFASYSDYSHLQDASSGQVLTSRSLMRETDSGTVTSIDSTSQTLIYQGSEGTSKPLDYDYIIISSGLRRPWPVVPRCKRFTSYLSDASAFTKKIVGTKKLGVVVVGGANRPGIKGAVGVEFAGKIRTHYPGTAVTLVHSRDQLLSNEPLPIEFKTRTLKLLQEQGIKVLLNHRADVEELPDGTSYVKLHDGNRLHTAMVIMATASSNPFSQFLPPSSIINGTINIDAHLRISSKDGPIPRMFAAGDVVNLPGVKLRGTAVVMESVAAADIYSSLVA